MNDPEKWVIIRVEFQGVVRMRLIDEAVNLVDVHVLIDNGPELSIIVLDAFNDPSDLSRCVKPHNIVSKCPEPTAKSS